MCEVEKRFRVLRESGYQGPIDQDGYAVYNEILMELSGSED